MRVSKEEFDQSIVDVGDGHDAAIENSSLGTSTGDFVESRASEKPDLIVDDGDLPATARELRDALAGAGCIFDRGMPVKVTRSAEGRFRATPLTAYRVVIEAHGLRRPVKKTTDHKVVQVTLPMSLARMYLAMHGEWNLPPLAGICTAPLLSEDGSVRTAEGYDSASGMWCASVPDLTGLIPNRPTRSAAAAALGLIRNTFKTFCFADAETMKDPASGVEVVDLSKPPGRDESSFLVALLTAVCRPSLHLAPGVMLRAAPMSGAGAGKGLLARCICMIAFGREPHAVTPGATADELEKRIAA
jgi:hypothetical protein